MYVVIFKAKIKTLDQDYVQTAQTLRELALNHYNCLKFYSITDGEDELALSYWSSLEDIANWKNDQMHQNAQKTGKDKWYRDYEVEIAEIDRNYRSD